MAERDLEMELYAAVWDALLAYQPFADDVPEGNRVRYDKVEGLNDPEDHVTADGDFHRAILWPRSGTDELRTTETTLASEGGMGCDGGVEESSYIFRLELISPWMGVSKLSRTAARARTALRNAGRSIGHDSVSGVSLSWETTKEVKDDTVRWFHRVDVRIRCVNTISDLT